MEGNPILLNFKTVGIERGRTMKGKTFVSALSLAFFLMAVFNGTAWAERNINFMFGQKNLDGSDWEPVENHTEFGMMFDFQIQNLPVSIAIDLLFSQDESTYLGYDVEGETREIGIGIRKYFSIAPQFYPYLGGGLALIEGEFSYLGYEDDDNGLGIWFSGGAVFNLSGNFNVGLDLRYSMAEVNLFGVDGEAGGTHFLIFAGFHF